MGNTHASLKNSIEIGEEIPRNAAIYRLWSDVRPCVKDKKCKCTLFNRHFDESDSAETRSFYENGLKTLRQLRHPCIVSYVGSVIDTNEVLLLTERVQMLDLIVDSLSPIEIQSGLKHILDALVFLHDKAQICHNNVSPLSIFVTMDGRWKLGGFECAQKLATAKHWVQTDFVRSMKISEFAPLEDKMMLSVDIPPTARDAYAFGRLIYYVMPYLANHLMAKTVSSLTEAAKCLTEDDASKRGELGGLSISYPEAFSNHLTAAVDFLQNLHTKTSIEKQEFFSKIVGQLRPMPEEVIGRRLVPLLLSRHTLLDSVAHESLIPFVLQPSVNKEDKVGLLHQASFCKWVIPEVMKIFCVHETAIRLALLSHFYLYMNYFTSPQLNVVLHELSLGMQDKDDRVVSASLHAMAYLVTVIGGPAVTGLTHTKIFVDGTPKKSGIFGCEPQWVSSPATDATIGSFTTEREISFSPSFNLSRLLKDDELPEQPPIKLQLEHIDSLEIDRKGVLEMSSTAKNDWNQAWEVDREEPVKECQQFGHENRGTNAATHRIPEISKDSLRGIEPDFFADMEPIVSKAPSLNFELRGSASAGQKSTSIPKIWGRFAAADDLNDSGDIGSWDPAAISDQDAD